MEDNIEYKVSTDLEVKIPTEFEGNGTLHIELPNDPSNPYGKTIEITFSSPIVVSQIKFEMPYDKAAKNVSISSIDQGVQYPDRWTIRGVSVLKTNQIFITLFFI